MQRNGRQDDHLHVLHTPPKRNLTVQFIACLVADVMVVNLLFSILSETFELLGIEFDQRLPGTDLLEWFLMTPIDLTAQHLFALMCAVLFIVIPIYAWISVLDASVLRIPVRAQRIGLVLSLGVSVLILVAEFAAIVFRASINAGGFLPQSDKEIALAVFYGLLAVALNVVATFFTASIHVARAQQKS